MSTTIESESSTPANDYEFTPTQDWFSFNIPTWTRLFPLVTTHAPRALEIGSWEGRSAVFLLTTLCAAAGEVVVIDHFDGLRTDAGRARHTRLTRNLAHTGRPHRVFAAFSVPALFALLGEEMCKTEGAGFDWVYVDGSHRADDTLLDAELAWRLARSGAIFIFDDYNWPEQPVGSILHPRRGIDAFLTLHAGEYERLSTDPEQYQMVLRKTAEMRIGFLVEAADEGSLFKAFEYGINIALAADAAYAMAAAVTICSAVEVTKGRITFYVIDCGLSDDDREKILASVPERPDVSLLFLDLPENGLVAEMGVVWAKIDMLNVLPVERVLYLDSDTLVRSDLGELWRTNLEGRSLGAAADVGYPMGHEGMQRGPYFNAGVLLLDLAKVRIRLQELGSRAREMKDAWYHDQDALNVHFVEDWTAVSLKWNAQGLGTYAEAPSADRAALYLGDMGEPGIVHFTGPVHPELAVVLNPWVKPYTSKPWGYASAPGHPFEGEWWDKLEKTAWRGWRESSEYRMMCKREKERVVQAAAAKLEETVTE